MGRKKQRADKDKKIKEGEEEEEVNKKKVCALENNKIPFEETFRGRFKCIICGTPYNLCELNPCRHLVCPPCISNYVLNGIINPGINTPGRTIQINNCNNFFVFRMW